MEIISVLKMDVDNKTIVKKHEAEDFNCKTQLIVQQSQEAIFYYQGVAQDVFGPGRYTLDTANLPVLSGLIKRVTGDESPFHAEVYFVNKVEQMGINWGTPDSFVVTEADPDFPEEEYAFNITARGTMNLKVDNSRKLIEKIVGTEPILSQEAFIDRAFEESVSIIKSVLSKTISGANYSIVTVDQHLMELGADVNPLINEAMLDYGIEISKFVVSNIKKPEDNQAYNDLIAAKNERLRIKKIMRQNESAKTMKEGEIERGMLEARFEAERKVLEAQARAASRQTEGFTYEQERGFDIAEAVASNAGTGNLANLGIGLGMMTGLGGTIGSQVANTANQAFANVNLNSQSANTMAPQVTPVVGVAGAGASEQENMIFCPSCGSKIPKGKFCMECGYKFEETTEPVCKNCGNKLLPGAKFCMECGTPAN